MPPLKSENQRAGESPEEYFIRVIELARAKETTIVIPLGGKYVDVDPTTTFDYLMGYWNCLKDNPDIG